MLYFSITSGIISIILISSEIVLLVSELIVVTFILFCPSFLIFALLLKRLKISQLRFEILDKFSVFCASLFDFLELSSFNLKIWNHNRFDINIILFHYIFITQVFVNFIYTLCVGICNFTIFLTIAKRNSVAPFFIVEFQIKVKYKKRMNHIDESKSHIALCLEVHW